MTIEAVIFDIGNVLIEWQPERYYDRTIGVARRQAMFAEVDLHEMNDLVDQGHHFTDTIYDWAEKYPGWRDEIRAWHDSWIELATPEIPHSVRLMRALRARGVPVFALTNFGVQNFDYACTVYPFLTEFDRAYVSGRMRMVKPHVPIYAAVEADCGLAPERMLFADDRAENIDTARARGWQVHHFTGPEGWAARLVAEGLLTEGEAA
ncbi:HAD family phosphatase [Ruegeria sp. PrR005]|uniref:HAD family phosphatase n=1 Tax=Ruegeria sp. PrR005 TaxID=2706882 RepID=A0A6B2NSJ2_9RHOB|nr:HAD family phosphatase [Ruegeria sp. PrR005]NDW46140.1 HAD family phosphatase [Ruegeria sp. PrR005]